MPSSFREIEADATHVLLTGSSKRDRVWCRAMPDRLWPVPITPGSWVLVYIEQEKTCWCFYSWWLISPFNSESFRITWNEVECAEFIISPVSSHSGPCLVAHWKALPTESLMSAKYCAPMVVSTTMLAPSHSGPKHQIFVWATWAQQNIAHCWGQLWKVGLGSCLTEAWSMSLWFAINNVL